VPGEEAGVQAHGTQAQAGGRSTQGCRRQTSLIGACRLIIEGCEGGVDPDHQCGGADSLAADGARGWDRRGHSEDGKEHGEGGEEGEQTHQSEGRVHGAGSRV
jgi:hypothetical protein